MQYPTAVSVLVGCWCSLSIGRQWITDERKLLRNFVASQRNSYSITRGERDRQPWDPVSYVGALYIAPCIYIYDWGSDSLSFPPGKGMGNPYRTRGGRRGPWSLNLGASRFGGSLEVWKPQPAPSVDVEHVCYWCGACMFLSITLHANATKEGGPG